MNSPNAKYKGDKPLALTPPAIWLAFLRAGRWKSWMMLGQFLVIVFLIATVIAANGRPPDVVLIEPDGKSNYVQASVASEALAKWVAEQKQQPTKITEEHFAREFAEDLLAQNSSTIDASWPRALAKMDRELRKKVEREATEKKTIEKVKALRVQTDVTIDKDNVVVVEEKPGQLAHVRAKIARTRRALMDTAPGVTDQLVLDILARVVPRTHEYPDGLSITNFNVEVVHAENHAENEKSEKHP